MTMKIIKGNEPHVQGFLGAVIFTKYHCPWNMPFLPVWKPGTDRYGPIQDLGAVTILVIILHPAVSNLCPLLNFTPREPDILC